MPNSPKDARGSPFGVKARTRLLRASVTSTRSRLSWTTRKGARNCAALSPSPPQEACWPPLERKDPDPVRAIVRDEAAAARDQDPRGAGGLPRVARRELAHLLALEIEHDDRARRPRRRQKADRRRRSRSRATKRPRGRAAGSDPRPRPCMIEHGDPPVEIVQHVQPIAGEHQVGRLTERDVAGLAHREDLARGNARRGGTIGIGRGEQQRDRGEQDRRQRRQHAATAGTHTTLAITRSAGNTTSRRGPA